MDTIKQEVALASTSPKIVVPGTGQFERPWIIVDNNGRVTGTNTTGLAIMELDLPLPDDVYIQDIIPAIAPLFPGIQGQYHQPYKTTLEMGGVEQPLQIVASPLFTNGNDTFHLLSLNLIDPDKHTVRSVTDTPDPYRTLFEQNNDAIFIVGLDLKIIDANSRAAQMVGYPIEELIGMPANKLISLEENSSSVVSSTQIFERTYVCKDGSHLPVEIGATIVRNSSGVPIHILNIVRDISERKRAEESLQRKDEILTAVSFAAEKLLQSHHWDESIPGILELLGTAARVSRVYIFEVLPGNNDARLMYEWATAEMTTWKEYLRENDLSLNDPRLQRWVNTLRQAKGMFSNIDELPDEEREIMAVMGIQSLAVFPIFVQDEWRGIIGFDDNSPCRQWQRAEIDTLFAAASTFGAAFERRQAEEKLFHSEARNKAIIDAIPDCILRVSASGTILDASYSEEHCFGPASEDMVNQPLTKLFPAEVIALMNEHIEKTLETGILQYFEFQMPDSNPKIEARIAVSGNDEVLIMMRDISDRARLEQLKTDFINRASHELRTPLTTATMMVELIQEGGTPEEITEYWQILHNELNRQRRLIDRLLTAGRLESNTLLISPAPVEILPIVEEAINALMPIARKKGLAIQKNLEESLPLVMGENMGLQQVLINLLSNAVKYTPGDESVVVSVYQQAGGVNIDIKDRGIGIPEEDLPNLFERFFRARNVTLAEIPGSGIGLYIVKSIVEELAGKILVQNNPDKGTTFSVWLRCAEE